MSLETDNPILANMIMIGVLVQTNMINLSRSGMEGMMREIFLGYRSPNDFEKLVLQLKDSEEQWITPPDSSNHICPIIGVQSSFVPDLVFFLPNQM